MDSIFEIIAFIFIGFFVHWYWRGQRASDPETCRAVEVAPSFVPDNGPWSVLEIKPTADIQDIKRAYRRLVKLYHPDIAGPTHNLKCARITEAYREALKGL